MVSTTQQQPASTLLQLNTNASYYKWLVAGIILMASATQTFAGSSVTLAIPRLMATFGADLAAAQWVTTGFLITRTLVTPLLGWLGGIVGNRTLFVFSLSGFVVTTIGCGLATSLPMLIVFRLMQGMALGPLGGLNTVTLVQTFPRHQRGLALGLRTLGSSAGQIISFTFGGYCIEHISWRLIFFLGVPSGLAAAGLGLLFLPQHREARGRSVDYPGLLALGGFLVPLLLAISFARNSETALSTLVLLSLSALCSSVLFVVWELHTATPAVNLRLFRLPAFRCICSTAFLNSMGLFTAQFMMPIFLQRMMGFTPMQAGLIIAPALVAAGLSGVITGRLTDLLPPPAVVLGGLLTMTGVFYALSSVTVYTTTATLVGIIVLYRMCMHTISLPVTALNAQVLEGAEVRMGQGLLGVVRNIGAGFGVTVASVMFERQRSAHQLQAYEVYNDASPAHVDTLDELKRLLHDGGIDGAAADRAALGFIRRQMDLEAIAAGFHSSFFLACVCFVLASLPMIWLLNRRYRR